MGIKHKTKPFWAVQYHPESVCTDKSGHEVFRNFWTLASEWRHANNKQSRPWDDAADALFGQPWPHLPHLGNTYSGVPTCEVTTSVLTLPHLSIPQICEVIGVYKANSDFVLLDSAAQPGRFAIIGCIHPNTVKIQYYIQDSFLTIVQGKLKTKVPLLQADIWTWLGSFMRSKKAIGGHSEVPFWGGLIGFLSYELGVDSLDVEVCRKTTKQGTGSPDVNLAFIDRSIVVDTKTERVYLQSLLYGDDDWFAHTSSNLQRAAQNWDSERTSAVPSKNIHFGKPKINIPDQHAYMTRVKDCQDFLFSGDSYELCYTARTRINLPKTPAATSQTSWDLYKTIRGVNPAPYAAYIRLYPTTLMSSSPERFLSYSRPPHQRLQLRPIKGTVRKGNGMTREGAEAILNTPKEIGENLMIVDLIRHDLYGVLGQNVEVTKFCGIEEYETVWQLVSVINGCPSAELEAEECDQIGWEMLKRSLPPGWFCLRISLICMLLSCTLGSMTGAPKKRSVQILQELESDERTIYSGVAGYWCVSGAGDWSVIIRSLYRCEDPVDEPNGVNGHWMPSVNGDDDSDRSSVETGEKSESSEEECPTGYDEWTLGSGGAITALSTPEGEWDEMLVKLQSVLRAFGATAAQ
jgi:para-aminobenzoate synthetase